MTLPVIRRYTLAAPGALNVFGNLTDDVTTQAPFTLFAPNAILDLVNDPDPPATQRFEFRLLKNGSETPVKVFSTAVSPTTAGRVAVGPINMSVGQYIWTGAERVGTLAATSIIVKYQLPIA